MADLNSTIVRGNLRVTEEIIGPLNIANLSTGANGQFLSISNNVPTWVNNPNTWRPLGTGANDAAAGNHSHSKSEIGLGNVDNTADANKSVNYATSSHLLRTYSAGNGSHGADYYLKCRHNVDGNDRFKLQIIRSDGSITHSTSVDYANSAGNADTVDGKHSSDFCLSNSNITNLPINGGIYWNSYVESSNDGSDAASITVIKDGNGANGTVLQIKQANDANDIVNVVAGDLRLNGTSVSTNGHTHDDRYYTESEINTKLNGKSDTSHTHTSLKSNTDNRNSNTTPNDYNGVLNIAGLKDNSKIGLDTNIYGTYSCLLGVRGWQDSSGGDSHEIALTGNGQIMHRSGSTTSWGGWDKIAHTSYIDTYFPRAKVGNDSPYSNVYTSFIGGVSDGPRGTGWEFLYRAEHRNGAGDGPNYIMEMVSNLTSDSSIYWRKKTGGSFTSFREIIDSNNIGSQNVNYANSAGSVDWGNVTGKPTNFVTTDTAQTISGAKTFSNTITANNWLYVPYIGTKTNKLYIEGPWNGAGQEQPTLTFEDGALKAYNWEDDGESVYESMFDFRFPYGVQMSASGASIYLNGNTNCYLQSTANGWMVDGSDQYGCIYPAANHNGKIGLSANHFYQGYINYIYSCNIAPIAYNGSSATYNYGSVGTTNNYFGSGAFKTVYRTSESGISDVRLKQNISNNDLNALNIINNLNIINFQYDDDIKIEARNKKQRLKAINTMKELPKTKETKELRKELQKIIATPNNEDMITIGVSAQQLQELLPKKYQKTFIQKESTNQYADQLFIKENRLVYLSFKAIQEQQAIIGSLEEKINLLEEKINALEEKMKKEVN